jgi:lysophospholipase L1-like esterase
MSLIVNGRKVFSTGSQVNTGNQVNVADAKYSAKLDGSTNDLTAINQAIADAKNSIVIPAGIASVDQEPENPLGIEYTGDGIIAKKIEGGLQQLNTYADNAKQVIGKEYLYRVYKRLEVDDANTMSLKVFLYGDSTVAGGNGESNWASTGAIIKDLYNKKGLKTALTLTNRGVAGTRITDMNAMPDLSDTTDLFIIKYGINDGYNNEQTRLTVFATALRNKLKEIRQSNFGSVERLSIVLVGPNSTSDTPNGRDERWYEQLRKIYVKAARDFKCAYIDTYAYLKDSRNAAGLWMDNPYNDGRAIHPLNLMNCWIWGLVIDSIFGTTETAKFRSNHFTNLSASQKFAKENDPPSSYPLGITINRALLPDGWPVDGAVITTRHADGITKQSIFTFAKGKTIELIRVASTSDDTWNIWAGTNIVPQLQNGWKDFENNFASPQAVLCANGIVTVNMIVKAGATAPGTVIATLPEGMRPAAKIAPFVCATSTGTCLVDVAGDGTISVFTQADPIWTAINITYRATQ